MKAKYARKTGKRRWWRVIVLGCFALLVAVCLARVALPLVLGVPYYVTESSWSIVQSPDDDTLGIDVGLVYPEVEVRPAPSPIPTVEGLELSERKAVAFAFYRLNPGDTVTVLSLKRRLAPDVNWLTVATAGADLNLLPEPRRVAGTLRTHYFDLAPNQPYVEFVEFELQVQFQFAGQNSVSTERTVVFQFQREDRSGLRFWHP